MYFNYLFNDLKTDKVKNKLNKLRQQFSKINSFVYVIKLFLAFICMILAFALFIVIISAFTTHFQPNVDKHSTTYDNELEKLSNKMLPYLVLETFDFSAICGVCTMICNLCHFIIIQQSYFFFVKKYVHKFYRLTETILCR